MEDSSVRRNLGLFSDVVTSTHQGVKSSLSCRELVQHHTIRAGLVEAGFEPGCVVTSNPEMGIGLSRHGAMLNLIVEGKSHADMAALQSPGTLPQRSNSLSRMLDLERKYKLQRMQDRPPMPIEAASQTPTSLDASSSSQSQALRPESLRFSPAYDDEQPMMPVERHGLPSLSLSPTTLPTPAAALSAEVHFIPATASRSSQANKEARDKVKTVTFSGPVEADDGAEEELSDESSICRSPTWERYGQKKKARCQKFKTEQKEKAPRPRKNSRRNPAKLTKPKPPQDNSTVQVQDPRKLIAIPAMAGQGRPVADCPPDTMANSQHWDQPAAQVELNVQPKAKGFFAGLRHGRRLSLSGSRPSTAEAVLVPERQQPQSAEKAAEGSSVDSRKYPPSANSNPLSVSCQGSRGQRHGRSRSHSFVSRLRGPSYLNLGGQGFGNKHASRGASPSAQSLGQSEQRPPSVQPPAGCLAAAPVALAHSKNLSEPGSLRGRDHHAQIGRVRDPSSDYDNWSAAESRTGPLDAGVPGRPVAEESKAASRQGTSYHARQIGDVASSPSLHLLPASTHQNQTGAKARGLQPATRKHAAVAVCYKPAEGAGDESDVSCYTEDDQEADPRLDHMIGDRHPVAASPIRPPSASGRDKESGRNRQEPSPTPPSRLSNRAIIAGRTIVPGVLAQDPRLQPQVPGEAKESLKSFREKERALRAQKSADYLSFISDPYAPPLLELTSPLDAKPSSPHLEGPTADEEEPRIDIPPRSKDRVRDIEPKNAGAAVLTDFPTDNRLRLSRTADLGPSWASRNNSDCHVPALRLGAIPNSVRIKVPPRPRRGQPAECSSRTLSASSSSSYYDAPLSPSTATSPDSSRPQSRREYPPDSMRTSLGNPTVSKATGNRKLYRTKGGEQVSHMVRADARAAQAVYDLTSQPDGGRSSAHTTKAVRAENLAIATPTSDGRDPPSATFSAALQDALNEDEGLVLPQRSKARPSLDSPTASIWPPKFIRLPHLTTTTMPTELDSAAIGRPPVPTSRKARHRGSNGSLEATNVMSAPTAHAQAAREAAPVPPSSSSSSRPRSQKQAGQPPGGAMSTQPAGAVPAAAVPPATDEEQPLAKMLVRCCSCRYLHDMPAKVYECMARPDAVVQDKLRGLSAAISTSVKCPWCTHNMSSRCCAGYAAVVYLKKKLHGR